MNLKNRKILEDGTVICNDDALIDILYSGQNFDGVFCDDAGHQEEWDRANRLLDTTYSAPIFADDPQYKEIDWYQYWRTPTEYTNIDLLSWCLDKCNTDEEIDRVNLEISEFEKRNMIPIMKHLIYCVDAWRENKIFWGVGRGSSVCSFVLYLIGINRINPLQYELNLNEWMR
jgi:DNA polymerase III alpha subunit